jgi:hypothetical protein
MLQISFHSLRPTATSLMKNTGISLAIVHDIIGTKAWPFHRIHTHVDEAAKRTALSAIPDVLA